MTLNILHQVVGRTRAGKTIFCAIESSDASIVCAYFADQGFSPDDLFDALAVFEYLSIRAKLNDDSFMDTYEAHFIETRKALRTASYEVAKSKLGIVTSVGLRNHGQRLVTIEFKDF